MEIASFVLGVLGVVGLVGLVTLRPQLTLTPGTAIRGSQPFSVPFCINNPGPFGVRDVRAICFVRALEYDRGIAIRSSLVGGNWTAAALGRADSKTIVCEVAEAPLPPRHADVILVVNYRWFGVPATQHFRFVGQYGDSWQWLAQPWKEVEGEVTAALQQLQE